MELVYYFVPVNLIVITIFFLNKFAGTVNVVVVEVIGMIYPAASLQSVSAASS
jgi:hypothetical protein